MWPTATGVYADVMNEFPKAVFSKTITHAAIGHGTGLFSVLRKPLRLEVSEARTFPSGTAMHVYRTREENT